MPNMPMPIARSHNARAALVTLIAGALVAAGGTSAIGRPAQAPVRSSVPALTSFAPAAKATGLHAANRSVVTAHNSGRKMTVGTMFTTSQAATVTTLRLFRTKKNSGKRVGALWLASGQRLATATFRARHRSGWQTARLSPPVAITAGERYVAAYVAPRGRYPFVRRALSRHPIHRGPLTSVQALTRRGGDGVPNRSGGRRYFLVEALLGRAGSGGQLGDSTSTLKDFPNASNVGVPAGFALTPYGGPLTITQNGAVIDGKMISGTLLIKASNVTITNSRINGILRSDYGGSVTVVDSSIDGGNQETYPAVSYSNITLRRVDVSGGEHSVQCSEYCVIVDSWLHDQYLPDSSSGHVNAFISNGGNHLVLRHNTLHCTVPLTSNDGGCSGDVSFFGDFDPISDVTVDNNYFRANQQSISYCLYAGYNPQKTYGTNPTRVSITNNVFERGANGKCGVFGPVTSFLNANGNVWSNNTWQGSTASIAAAQ